MNCLTQQALRQYMLTIPQRAFGQAQPADEVQRPARVARRQVLASRLCMGYRDFPRLPVPLAAVERIRQVARITATVLELSTVRPGQEFRCQLLAGRRRSAEPAWREDGATPLERTALRGGYKVRRFTASVRAAS